ncbi:SPOR domain-containing protein [Roseibium sp. RKSG952]|uniref:SPOR domain-containing protein n=1 Tax=Roseibium sp. RKSG952 TaxID=2529384 RepID=UPI0012BC99B9|nr:SPOR domain-containing protein [Roseibium sp. RKSG952]MTH97109.1 SPOR domain-containing protein [Roseibium sp. RKSG952]
MKRATGTRFGPHRLAVLAVTLTALTACDEALIPGNTSTDPESDEAQANDGTVELLPVPSGPQRDVEAPDVFQTTEAGLWDGRPSLGGIWVAHPDAKQPERVLIKNTANNKKVTGALFRRERDLPGPVLQVSSAAASELGMLAGSPTRLQVVALRREETEPTPPPAPAETEENETTGEDTAATAADATSDTPVEAAEKPAKRKWWQKKEPENTGAVAAGAAAGAAAVAASGDAASGDTAAEAAEAVAETASPTAALSDAPVAPPPEKPAKRKWWQKKKPNEITETPLDPIAGAAAAIEASEPTPAAASTSGTSALTKPYIQVGTFGIEANANSAADKIRSNGMLAEVRELKSGDKPVWRVLVGPAMTRAERKAILGDVKDLGFADAFTVKN